MRGKINEENFKWVDGQIEGIVYRYILGDGNGSESGWSYVGETATESERIKSWRNKGNRSYGGTKIDKAREQYGWRAFRYEVLEKVYAPTIEELRTVLEEREGYWIEKLDSVNNGFNTSNEGTGMKGVKLTEEQKKQCGDYRRGKPMSEEGKQKISKAGKGRKRSDETKAKISAGNKGKKRTAEMRKAESERMKGKVMSEEARRKSSMAKKGKAHPISPEGLARINEARYRRAVIAINDLNEAETYRSMVEAGRAHKLGAGSISNFIRTGGRSKDGFRFKWAA